jgi:hypothetical protein
VSDFIYRFHILRCWPRGGELSSTAPAHRVRHMCFIGFAFWDAGLHPDEGRRALKYRACVQNVSDVIHRFRILGRRPTPRRGVKISQVPRPRTECVSCYSWACHFGMQTTLIGPGRLHANLFPKPSRPQVHSSADSPRIVCRCFYTHWGNINPTIASVGSPELMFSIVFYSHWGFISPTIASVGSPEFMLPIVFYPHWGNIRLTNCSVRSPEFMFSIMCYSIGAISD